MDVNVCTIGFVQNLQGKKCILDQLVKTKALQIHKLPFGIVSLCSAVACAVSATPCTPYLRNALILRGNQLSSYSTAVLNRKREGCHQLVASQFFSDTAGA
jgi:hypothetical protein